MTATATLDMPVASSFKSHSENTMNPNTSDFLKDNLPKVEGTDFFRIIHLWNNNYRVNYYKYERNSINVTRFPIMLESYFLEVIKDEHGKMKIKNHTLIDRENYRRKNPVFQEKI